MSTAVTEPEPSPQPWLKRIPAPLFTVVYGALVILVVFGTAMAAGYTADTADTANTVDTTDTAEATSSEGAVDNERLPQPERPFNPPAADPDNVAASIRSHLITNVRVGKTDSGAMMRGDIVDGALDDTTEIAGHLSRLLEQNCLDTVTLTSKSGMRFNFWGFCFSTLPPATIAQLMDFGVDEEADSVAFAVYPVQGNFHTISLNWMDAGDTDDIDELIEQWQEVERPDEIDRITFNGYTDEEVVVMDNDKKTGEAIKRWPRFTNAEE